MNDTFMDDDSDYLMPSDSNDVPDTLTNFVDYIGAAHHQQQMYSPHIKNGTDDDSNKLIRLVLYSLVSTAGSMGGIFIISAITVIDTLQVRGNSYLCSLAFGHLMVTIFVLPASVVSIMAGIEDKPDEQDHFCHFQWLITLICLIVSVLSFMFMSIDNYFGLGSIVTYELCCTKLKITFILLLIWICSIGFSLGQHFNDFGPEFCLQRRNLKIMINYHPYILGLLILATLITIWYFTRSMFQFKSYKLQLESVSTSISDPNAFILTDGILLQSNIIVYIVSLLMWCPFIVVMVIDSIQPVTQDLMNTTWWIAISNSCCFSYVYAASNRDFREAFNKLFYYCCCKSHVTFTRKGAAMRRGFASSDPMGLRVHIIPGLHSGIGRNQGLDVRGSSGHHHQGISSHPLSHSMIAGGAFAKTFQSKTSSEL